MFLANLNKSKPMLLQGTIFPVPPKLFCLTWLALLAYATHLERFLNTSAQLSQYKALRLFNP